MPTGPQYVLRESTVFERESGQRAEAEGVSDTLALTAVVGIRAQDR